MIPYILTSALEKFPKDNRFELLEGWIERAPNLWSFQFRVKLSEQSTIYIWEWTVWHLVAVGSLANPNIRIYPDATSGITVTFPHQDYNEEISQEGPWRLGKPCLERPIAAFQRQSWSGEPADFTERLIWWIGRLLLWIDAAATESLLKEGDPFELPVYPTRNPAYMLGFCETQNDLNWWSERSDIWGFATISKIPGAIDTAVVSAFMNQSRQIIRKVKWSNSIPTDSNSIDAVWLMLPKLVVFEPWRSPSTWQELSNLLIKFSINLPDILAEAGAKLRRIDRRPKDEHSKHLIIGFPIAEHVGKNIQRIHWIAIQNLKLCGRKNIRKGFSGRAEARRQWDKDLATSTKPLEWRRTANWASDQLRKRGEAEDEIRSKSILIIGVGTLGSAIAENLLRMGVTRMALLDYDKMLIGNLSRNLLTMADVGHPKVNQMAKRLNMATPDAAVIAFPFEFPPNIEADVNKLKKWDVIVDCTASDVVLHAMSKFPWGSEKIFASLSMTWKANGMFAYAASETGFPAIDAIERFSAISPSPHIESIGEMEGIGCWHPVFPATADDVSLWGAIGSKFIRMAILNRKKIAVIFTQQEDGSVKRTDA